MSDTNNPSSNKVTIELDSKTAHELTAKTHNGLVAGFQVSTLDE